MNIKENIKDNDIKNEMCTSYNIKEIAEMFNISTNKIRFYEKKKLINPERNPNNNYRIFYNKDIEKIQIILVYRALGFSIESIGQLLEEDANKHFVSHLYTQWQYTNDQIHKFRVIQGALEKLMDDIYCSNERAYLKDIKKSAEHIKKALSEKNNWKDTWDFDGWASTYDDTIRGYYGEIEIYEYYDKLLNRVFEISNECLIKQNTISPKVLDIGTGTGNLAEKYLDKGIDIIGIDQSREMLNQAKKKLPNYKVRLGEFLKLPFDNGRFDQVVSTYAFHHLDKAQKELGIDEMLRVIKPYGSIIIGDMMFLTQEEMDSSLDEMTEKEKAIILDEYYSIVLELKEIAESRGKQFKYEKNDAFNYIITIY